MKRRRAVVVLALILLAVAAIGRGVFAIARTPVRSAATSPGDAAPQAPPVAFSRRPSHHDLPAELHGIPIAEARAYAALGALADGRSAAMDLGDDARAAREQAQEDLAAQAPKPGAGRAQVLPGGSVMAIAPRRSPPPSQSARGISPGASVEEAVVLRELTTIAVPGDVTRRSDAHVISGRGVWAGISLHPGDGPLRIVDEGDGGYAFTCHGDDFGTVRVNGGIVVPGRHYRIQGAVTITSAVEVGVDIVPLEAVTEYWDQPFTRPTGAG